jgi:alpha,alpha-trehalose phosphorylase
MAEQNLRAAADAAGRYAEQADEMGVAPEEAASWRAAANAMLIPFDERLGVHPQSETWTEHSRWNFRATDPEHYPLLLHFPYFELYSKQVVKQADLVLAMHLRGDAFSHEQKARNFTYYEALTVRDSSLSSGPQAVIAAEVARLELAHDDIAETALVDLHDLDHNTGDGLHVAARLHLDRARRRSRRHTRPPRHAGFRTPLAAPGAWRLCFRVNTRRTIHDNCY